jgi:two-component system response regulator PilR (NtrC family)
MSSLPNVAARVLVVDDEPDLRTLYELTLLREGYRVETAGSLAQARQQLAEHRFDAIITDMRLPDGLGLTLLHDLSAQRRAERCVVMTAYGSAENAVEALKAGAFDYLTKPVDLKQFRLVVASAVEGTAAPLRAQRQGAAHRAARADAAGTSGASALQRLVGNSESMLTVKDRVQRVARNMAPVLIRGESGTGKELVARAIHACSHRAERPFVAVNCGAIPENLLEAEFFGAKKGSYTGATNDREGYFQAAGGGTLFLDEIGDLPLAMQSKLLRSIQERTVRSLGSTQEDAVDVRIISATHKDLNAAVLAHQFRQDLYYRLNVIEIVVPPLRERREDLPLLCEALLTRIAQESGIAVPELPAHVLQQLLANPLVGNVRELENLLHRAIAMGDGESLQLDAPGQDAAASGVGPGDSSAAPAGPPAVQPPRSGLPSDLQAHLDELERDILVQALQEAGFNRTAAAARLGLSLRQIRYRIARLNIDMPGGDSPSADTGPDTEAPGDVD